MCLNGVIPMLKSYRIHEEQIKSVAKTMKELYHTRRETSPFVQIPLQTRSVSRTRNLYFRMANPGFGQTLQETETNGRLLLNRNKDDKRLIPKSIDHSVQPIQCFQCGDRFPITDFYYTKKSGLCIACWEATMV